MSEIYIMALRVDSNYQKCNVSNHGIVLWGVAKSSMKICQLQETNCVLSRHRVEIETLV